MYISDALHGLDATNVCRCLYDLRNFGNIDHQIALDNSAQNMNNSGQELEILINTEKKTVPVINTERQQRT